MICNEQPLVRGTDLEPVQHGKLDYTSFLHPYCLKKFTESLVRSRRPSAGINEEGEELENALGLRVSLACQSGTYE